MKIRRYLGSNAQEAILKVKMDLGNEALILNTKKVRQKGILKIFSKPMVEVLAAVDETKVEPAARAGIKDTPPLQKKAGTSQREYSANSMLQKTDNLNQLESRVNNMENILHKIYEKVNSKEGDISGGIASKVPESSGYLQAFYNNLVKNEVEQELARYIINQAGEKVTGDFGVTDVATAVYNIISSILGKPQNIKLSEHEKPTVAVFVGPTGVGKTTTLAKIAANYTLNHKKSVGLITTDTYRISAVDQLKTYAEIMGIPVSVIYSAEEVNQAVEAYRDKDLILIDTAGRSNKDKQQFEDVSKIAELTGTDEIYLVLSATTSTRNMNETIENYAFLKNYKLILTKTDESTTSGIILNAKYKSGKCLSYVTTGQSVPDDIEPADVGKIVKNLMGSINK